MTTKFYKERIPVWALCALINGDYTGLEDEDIAIIEQWWDTTGYCHVWSPADEEEPYFSSWPAFGLPCEVIECYCY